MFGIYLIIGAIAGTLAGMLGIGGGVIIVPALSLIFYRYSVMPTEHIMQMSIGTSSATIIVTLFSALRSHVTHDAVRWGMVKRFMPWLMMGAVIGAIIAHDVPSHWLRIFFGVFLIYIAVHMFFAKLEDITKQVPPKGLIRAIATLIGMLATVLGAGGGTMLIPFLMRCKINLREAIGTAVACTTGMCFVSAICFMLLGFSVIDIKWSTGYIYWPAFLGIVLTSVPCAPIGNAIANMLSPSVLKLVLAIFLLLVALEMLLPFNPLT